MIHSCPYCHTDLEPEDGTLWCPTCQCTISYAQVAGDT